MAIQVPVKKIAPGATLPTYAHPGDAGADLYASGDDYITITNEPVAVSTGVAVAIPEGYVGFITPRSGLAAKYGVTVSNAPGTIDSGYRGELEVLMHTIKPGAAYTVELGDRIAQLVILPIETAEVFEVDDLDETVRGLGGFGSTGN